MDKTSAKKILVDRRFAEYKVPAEIRQRIIDLDKTTDALVPWLLENGLTEVRDSLTLVSHNLRSILNLVNNHFNPVEPPALVEEDN